MSRTTRTAIHRAQTHRSEGTGATCPLYRLWNSFYIHPTRPHFGWDVLLTVSQGQPRLGDVLFRTAEVGGRLVEDSRGWGHLVEDSRGWGRLVDCFSRTALLFVGVARPFPFECPSCPSCHAHLRAVSAAGPGSLLSVIKWLSFNIISSL